MSRTRSRSKQGPNPVDTIKASSGALLAHGTLVLYAGVGSALLHYTVDVGEATLQRQQGTAFLPANVQYVCAHASGRYLYVVSSNGAPGKAGDAHYVNAFLVAPGTGMLSPHSDNFRLPHRPIHVTTDATSEHLLIAYNDASLVTVIQITRDGTLGMEIKQSPVLDTGIFVHQIMVMPSNQVVIAVARGLDADANGREEPGALKLFRYQQGFLSNWVTVAPRRGSGFGPRNIEMDPTREWLYVSLERQNKLQVFQLHGDSVSADPLFERETLLHPRNLRPKQMAGAVHVHPNGRFVYLANRAFGVSENRGEVVSAGGENTIAVYKIEQATGRPSLIQIIDTRGFYPRTFMIDPTGRMLVAANLRRMSVRDGCSVNVVFPNLSLFSIEDDGLLTYVRTYDFTSGAKDLFWCGMTTCPAQL